jgi:hypothetical protein
MNFRADHANLGSARVSRAGFGVSPKQSFHNAMFFIQRPDLKSSRKRDAFASTRDARATQRMR